MSTDTVHNRVKELIKVPLNELVALQGDLKRLDESSYKKFKSQLLDNGFTSPFHIWIDKKGKKKILDGHQRLRTLKMMKDDGFMLPEAFPAAVIEADNEKQARKILLGLAAVYGKMTDESLSDFMIESEIDMDWLNTNIDLPFISGLDEEPSVDGNEGLTDPDEVPELPKEPRSKLGDIWKLGDHRLMCGDSTSIDAVEKLMNGEKADMVFTDPPYGIAIKNTKGSIEGDEDLSVFEGSLPVIHAFLSASAHVYVYFGVQKLIECAKSFSSYFPIHNLLVQRVTHENKPSPADRFASNYELCFFSNHGSKAFQSGVLQVSKTTMDDARYKGDGFLKKYPALIDVKSTEHNLKSVHPTQKTVEICSTYIEISSKSKERVLDLFGGSGSTLIACEKTNRKCFMMELDPHYIDVIIERWEMFTGKKAELISE